MAGSFAGSGRVGLVIGVPKGRSGLEDAANFLVVFAVAIGPDDLLADAGDGLDQKLADVGDDGRVAGGNRAGSFEDEKAAEGVVDRGVGAEIVEWSEEFGGKVGGGNISDWHGALAGRAKSDWHGALAGRTKSGVRCGRARVACAEGGVGFFSRKAATASGGVAVVTAAGGFKLLLGDTSEKIGGSGWEPRVVWWRMLGGGAGRGAWPFEPLRSLPSPRRFRAGRVSPDKGVGTQRARILPDWVGICEAGCWRAGKICGQAGQKFGGEEGGGSGAMFC